MTISLTTSTAFAAAARGAHSMNFAAYTLHAGPVRAALAAAAQAGAAVRVRLERDPLDDAAGTLHAANAASIAALLAAGADAALTPVGAPVLHMKAAVADGIAWLDDRNWAADGSEIVLRDDDPADVAVVAAALAGGVPSNSHLATTKAGAQRLEVAFAQGAGSSPLAIATESFGSGAIYDTLLARARAGVPTRLLVAGREADAVGSSGDLERRRLARLAALGVEIRTGDPKGADLDEKLAVAGQAAWVGSANATYAHGPAGDQRDWGMVTQTPALVDGLRAVFERDWASAQALQTST